MESQNITNQQGIKSVKQPTNLKSMILFEDEDYILVNKPPFLSTLEDRHGRQNLLALARRICGKCSGLPPAGQRYFGGVGDCQES